MQIKKLHPVSIIMVACCFMIVITTIAEFIMRGLSNELFNHSENIWASGHMSSLISDLAYGISFIGTAAIIEYLRNMLAALEKGNEKSN